MILDLLLIKPATKLIKEWILHRIQSISFEKNNIEDYKSVTLLKIPGFGVFYASRILCWRIPPTYEDLDRNTDLYYMNVLRFRPYGWAKSKKFRQFSKEKRK